MMINTNLPTRTAATVWLSRMLSLLTAVIFTAITGATANSLAADEVVRQIDIAYKPKAVDDYERQRCQLDMHWPVDKPIAALVWFHGGGLENGDKASSIAASVVERFTRAGCAVASVNYRLSPKATFPAYIDDAAAAVAFVKQAFASRGGDSSRLFVSGHSAGGYLTSMLAVAPEYLQKHGLKPTDIAGFMPISGQMVTHATVRKERGIPKTRPMIDAAAPAWHVDSAAPPMLVIWGDEDLPTRAEENQYFVAAMRAAGNTSIESLHLPARTHDTIASRINQPGDEVASTMEKFIRTHRSSAGKEPSDASSGSTLTILQTNETITIADGTSPILVYNKKSPPAPAGMDEVYQRSGFLHPVYTPKGEVVTGAFPYDHPHQHGIFSAWVKTTYDGHSADFWNLAGKTGRVLHERLVGTFDDRGAVGFEVDLLHRTVSDNPVDVLRERWKVTARPTDGTYRMFDLETTQRLIAKEPLIIEKYHYGGIAYRGPTRWLLPNDGSPKNDEPKETVNFRNSEGHDRVAGNHAHARWVSVQGQLHGQPAGIIIMDHPLNFRAPQASRLHPTKPYFCFAACVDGEFKIDADHPFHSRYRMLITDQQPDTQWIEGQWKQWSTQ